MKKGFWRVVSRDLRDGLTDYMASWIVQEHALQQNPDEVLPVYMVSVSNVAYYTAAESWWSSTSIPGVSEQCRLLHCSRVLMKFYQYTWCLWAMSLTTLQQNPDEVLPVYLVSVSNVAYYTAAESWWSSTSIPGVSEQCRLLHCSRILMKFYQYTWCQWATSLTTLQQNPDEVLPVHLVSVSNVAYYTAAESWRSSTSIPGVSEQCRWLHCSRILMKFYQFTWCQWAMSLTTLQQSLEEVLPVHLVSVSNVAYYNARLYTTHISLFLYKSQYGRRAQNKLGNSPTVPDGMSTRF